MTSSAAPPGTGPLARLTDLRKEYRNGGGAPFVAVDDVSLDIRPGETLAIVGESGSGKTTLTRLLLGLVAPTAGSVEIGGKDIARLDRAGWSAVRREMQVVFQDPYSSMNPRMRVGDIVAEPLVTHRKETRGRRGREARTARVAELLTSVGLDPSAAGRYPHEFSGGQRQRISIARALALRPRLVVLDEPTSALDVSVQAQVLDLLERLQRELGTAYVFVSHNLAVVRQIADRVAVLRSGALVELAGTAELFDSPREPYTRALLDAVLEPDPTLVRRRRVVAS
jgi:oligopeptide transport system ATP-binding protein